MIVTVAKPAVIAVFPPVCNCLLNEIHVLYNPECLMRGGVNGPVQPKYKEAWESYS